MKTKLISLQTILLTVLVLFIFSASTNAQVSQELRTTVTRQISIPFRGWSKVYNVGETINLFSYEKKSGKYHFGIYSNDFAFLIVTDDIPFDVKEKELKKLPKPQGDLNNLNDEKLKKHYKDALIHVHEKALAGKYKTKASDFLASTGSNKTYVKENEPITIIGFKEEKDYTGYYLYFAIIKEDAADIYRTKYDKNTQLWNVPLHLLPSTESSQVKAVIEKEKSKIIARKNAEKEDHKLQYRNKALRGEIKGVLAYDVSEPFGKNGIFEGGDTVCIVGYASDGGSKYYALYSDKNAGNFRAFSRVKKVFENEDKIEFDNLPDIDDPDVKNVIKKQLAIVDSISSIRLAESREKLAEKAGKLIQMYKKSSPFLIHDISWNSNSAGGITVSLNITNCANQTIKYVTFQGYFLNAVGDRCRNEIGGNTTWKARGVGPIGPCPTTIDNCAERIEDCVGSYTFDNLTFYSRIANTFRLSSVTVEYMNGKKATLSGAELKKRVKYTD